VDIQRSARRHGIATAAIEHAVDYALVVIDLEPDADPPRVPAIGPDEPGKLLEIMWLELPDRAPVVIHAVGLRRTFYDLPPSGEDDA